MRKSVQRLVFAGAIFVVASGLALIAAPKPAVYAATYTITTTIDENSAPGVGAGCSFYEAGQAIATGVAYGGCPAPSASGNIISFPTGTYTQTMAFTLSAADAAGLSIVGSTGTIIDAPSFANTSSASIDITASNVTVSNLSITGGGNLSVTGSGATLSNVHVSGPVNNYLYVQGAGARLSNVSFTPSAASTSPWQIELYQVDNAVLSNVTADYSAITSGSLGAALDITGNNVQVTNANIIKSPGDGIDMNGSLGVLNNTTVNGTARDGIGVYGNGTTITGATLTNIGNNGIGAYADNTRPSPGTPTTFNTIAVNTTGSDGIDLYDGTPAALAPTLQNVTVRNVASGHDGIGIYADNAQLNNVLIENGGRYGIYAGYGIGANQAVSFKNITVNRVQSKGLNVGFNNNGSLTLDGITVQQANLGGASYDEGIELNSMNTVTARGLYLVDNAAGNGMSVYGNCSSVTTVNLTDSYIAQNNTNASNFVDGGGIYASCTRLALNRVTIADNTSTLGGGVYMEDGLTTGNATPAFLSMLNSTIWHNTATTGGAIYLSDTATGGSAVLPAGYTFANVTLANNIAPTGSGLYIARSGQTTPNPILTNSIIANNTSGLQCASDNPFGTFGNGSVGNIATSGDCPGFTVTNPLLATALSTPTTAALIGANGSGGNLPVLALMDASPAIDTGNATVCPAVDERLQTRPVGAGCDVGSFEWVSAVAGATTSVGIQNASPTSSLANTGTSLVGVSIAVVIVATAGGVFLVRRQLHYVLKR